MIKNAGKFRTICETVFCFITSALIAVIALNIGLKTEPGTILPEGISMRSGEMCKYILRGIEDSSYGRLLSEIRSVQRRDVLLPVQASEAVQDVFRASGFNVYVLFTAGPDSPVCLGYEYGCYDACRYVIF